MNYVVGESGVLWAMGCYGPPPVGHLKQLEDLLLVQSQQKHCRK